MEGEARRRRLECRGDEIVDLERDAPVTPAELVALVRGGGRFTAVDRDSGRDMTLVVLARLLESFTPGRGFF